MTEQFSQIRYHVSDAIATITLHRPDRLNAFTKVMLAEMTQAMDAAEADERVRAVIVTGGGRAFCAGADLSGGASRAFTAAGPPSPGSPPAPELIGGVPRDGGGMLALRLAASRKPLIAAVNGAAAGVGATMTLPMDIRIASEQARFSFPFARRGIAPDAASSWFLPRVVGISQAAEWVLTGRVFGAQEAHRGGLVSDVVPAGELLPRARQIAAEIAGNTSPVSVAASRQMLWAMLGEPSPWTAHLIETLVVRKLALSGEAAEGVASFMEKRPPSFPLRLDTDYPAAAPAWPSPPPGLAEQARALARQAGFE